LEPRSGADPARRSPPSRRSGARGSLSGARCARAGPRLLVALADTRRRRVERRNRCQLSVPRRERYRCPFEMLPVRHLDRATEADSGSRRAAAATPVAPSRSRSRATRSFHGRARGLLGSLSRP
jgi:hypothetical protein